MGIGRKLAGTAVIAALLATSATPAFARGPGGWNNGGWGGHYDGWRHRRHRDRVSGGDVVAGIVILGAIAAIASAASKNKDRPRDDRYPDNRYPENRPDRGEINSEDAAVDACALAAEQRATSGGDTASVREITAVDRAGDGWEIRGIVETRRGYRDNYAISRDFTCSVRYGQVDNIRIDSGVAYR